MAFPPECPLFPLDLVTAEQGRTLLADTRAALRACEPCAGPLLESVRRACGVWVLLTLLTIFARRWRASYLLLLACLAAQLSVGYGTPAQPPDACAEAALVASLLVLTALGYALAFV